MLPPDEEDTTTVDLEWTGTHGYCVAARQVTIEKTFVTFARKKIFDPLQSRNASGKFAVS